jgi:predicted helicase
MTIDHRKALLDIKSFGQLIAYLRDELGWPISRDSFDDVDDLFYDFSAEELGIDPKTAAKIQNIKRLRPLSAKQPWGIFFVKFEPKKLPVVALRRILSQVALKKRESANSSERTAWSVDDLLFISNYGEGDERQINFAHFSQPSCSSDLPTLRVLGWNSLDTPLRLDAVATELSENLRWPEDDGDLEQWRKSWSNAFKLGHNEVINTAKDLSIRLAGLASTIRDRIKLALAIESESGPLTKLMRSFQTSLVNDLDVDGFADMYAQTIAYGLLSARITDPSKKTVDDFTSHMRTSPFLKELMETFLKVGGRKGKAGGPGIDFDELGVGDVLQLLDAANMEAVIRDFGDRNRQEDPVMHFFEGFLEAYDKKIRKDRGVFYTPQPVVSYIVRSIHEIIKKEFGLEDGLADITTWGEMAISHPNVIGKLNKNITISPNEPFIQILDPATGTATFIVEVIDIIFRTLFEKWSNQGSTLEQINNLWNDYVPKHLLPRIYAYELMMAPYAIAHMKIGLKLAETGYMFNKEERARVYLTNALESSQDQIKLPEFEALAHEAEAVNEIKKHKKFTVVIGNPPYSKISSNLSPEMRSIVERYRFVDGERIRERGALQFEINLQDDYVKFCRFCEERIIASGVGVLGLITNNGYLSTPTLRGMRNSLLETFNSIWVLDLHGHIAKGEKGPDGDQEENVFDIVQGVSILMGARDLLRADDKSTYYAEKFGSREKKYNFLRSSDFNSSEFQEIYPAAPFYLFMPHDPDLTLEWSNYAGISEIFLKNSAGIVTARDALVLDENKEALIERMKRFSSSSLPEEDIYKEFGFSESKRFDLREAQGKLSKISSLASRVRKILHRPFDERYIFFDRSVIWSMSKPMADQMAGGDNLALIATRQVTRPQFEHAFVSKNIIEIKSCSHDRNTQIFPLFIKKDQGGLDIDHNLLSNLNPVILSKFSKDIGLKQAPFVSSLGENNEFTPLKFFYYIYAILYSLGYRKRYYEFLRSDFPRIPPCFNNLLFKKLAALGGSLVRLHTLENFKVSATDEIFSGPKDFSAEKISWSQNTIWLDKNLSIGFRGVSKEVWEFRIGGYQVCDKWLKDRKGKKLSDNDINHYQKIISSLTQTLQIMDEIDAVIDEHGGWPGAFT